MRRHLLRKLTFTLFVLLGLTSWNSMRGQGFETFDNFTAEGSSYQTGTFDGQDGSEWNYIQSRGDYEITGKAIMIGRSRTPQANFYSGTIAGGVGTISFDYMQAFSNNVNLNVLVNDVVVGNVTTSGEQEVIKASGDFAVNAPGDVVIKFINVNNSDGQVVVDNITWTGFAATPGTLSDFALSSYALTTNEEFTITWSALDVDFVKFQIREEPDDGEWFDPEELQHVDATLGTIAYTIPIEAPDGNYVMRISDATNPTTPSLESTPFTITDNHFAGLYADLPFFPFNGSTDVPIDLFGVIQIDNEGPVTTMHHLIMNFAEEVAAGTGNITLYKTGGVVVKQFNVETSADIVFNGPQVTLIPDDNLEANTQYYVTVDNGAIVDQATTPNAFDGFSNPTTWSFTTGEGDSFYTIPEIRGTEDVPALLGQTVQTSGLVTHKHPDGIRFWIQDDDSGFNGIMVYDGDAAGSVNIGDIISIVGTVAHYQGLAELIDIISVNVESTNNPVVPIVINLPFSEKWESMLVQINNVYYTDEPPVSGTEFEVSDGTNTGLVDDWLYAYTPSASEQFESIAGILNYFNEFKIAPRYAADIVSTPVGVNNPEASGLMIAPNPVTDLLYITAPDALSNVQVINIAGSVVKEIQLNGDAQTTLQMGNLPQGLYLLRITTVTGETLISKVIKR